MAALEDGNRFFPCRGNACDLEVVFTAGDERQAVADDRVIIDDKNANRGQRRAYADLTIGNSAITWTPAPGADSMVQWPPASAARSFMLISP